MPSACSPLLSFASRNYWQILASQVVSPHQRLSQVTGRRSSDWHSAFVLRPLTSVSVLQHLLGNLMTGPTSPALLPTENVAGKLSREPCEVRGGEACLLLSRDLRVPENWPHIMESMFIGLEKLICWLCLHQAFLFFIFNSHEPFIQNHHRRLRQ